MVIKIAIVGARERDTQEDRELVGRLIEQIAAEAPNTIFVTTLTHMGVGLFAREKCLEKTNGRYRFQMLECSVRIYAQGLSKSDTAEIYMARNATPFELSDMLVYLASEDRRGTMEDLLDRFTRSGRPHLVLMPGDVIPQNIVGAMSSDG